MSNTTVSAGGEYLPRSYFDAQSRSAALHLGRDGLSMPLQAVPRGWGAIICTYDFARSEAPGPHRYEGKPLAKVTQRADLALISLHSGSFDPTTFPAQAADAMLRAATIDVWLRLREGETVFLVKTLWPSLAPWESYLRKHLRPSADLQVLDGGGLRSVAHLGRHSAPHCRRRNAS